MEKAKLFKQLPQKQVQCLACQRYCQIGDGQLGFCQTRLNQNGQLYSLTFGILNGIQVDPIEKKPLYHFYPGSQVLSFGSYGCNYRCKQCLNSSCSWGQNAQRLLASLKSQALTAKTGIKDLKRVEPSEIIALARQKNIPGIAFTYNEPVIWPEYVYQTARLAKKKGLYTVLVTNGSWSREGLKYLAPVIDAVNIDIKGFYPVTYQKMGAFLGEILTLTELAVRKYQLFTELTTLVIPQINDSAQELKAIAQWIRKNLGRDIPWHLSRFDPQLAPNEEFRKLPVTPVKTLKKAYQIGKKADLQFVYLWAPPASLSEKLFSIGNTFCPKCGKLIIKRKSWRPELIAGRKKGVKTVCSFCQRQLNLVL